MLDIFTSAIHIRNREVVDRADLIICYVEEKQSGAWQTIQYAIKQRKAIINLAQNEENLTHKQIRSKHKKILAFFSD